MKNFEYASFKTTIHILILFIDKVQLIFKNKEQYEERSYAIYYKIILNKRALVESVKDDFKNIVQE